MKKLLATFILLAGHLPVLPAISAESFDSCTGTVTSVPTTISTQGTWCMSGNLATAIQSGSAINIAANNVTLDCNGFKLGGLAAGSNSTASGILANERLNVTVRNCGVRGFYIGIDIIGGSGHLIQDNRLDQNLYIGISATGESNRIERNRIFDTGGAPDQDFSYGINANADAIDNSISGVFSAAANAGAYGILLSGTGNEARDNRVRNVTGAGTGQPRGICVTGNGSTMTGNRVAAEVLTTGFGLCGAGADTFCTFNTIYNFTTPISSCEAASGNLVRPAQL